MTGVDALRAEIDELLAATPGEIAQQARPAAGPDYQADLAAGQLVIFTDGGCDPNPGPGGYGVVLLFQDQQGALHRKELSGGFRRTTNNRMELRACIEGLQALKRPLPVVLYSDSKYVVDAITLGWARRWRDRGWYRNQEDKAENVDLWGPLLELGDRYEIEWRWVKGHAGIAENERCDQLALAAGRRPDLPPDTAYEEGATQVQAALFR